MNARRKRRPIKRLATRSRSAWSAACRWASVSTATPSTQLIARMSLRVSASTARGSTKVLRVAEPPKRCRLWPRDGSGLLVKLALGLGERRREIERLGQQPETRSRVATL